MKPNLPSLNVPQIDVTGISPSFGEPVSVQEQPILFDQAPSAPVGDEVDFSNSASIPPSPETEAKDESPIPVPFEEGAEDETPVSVADEAPEEEGLTEDRKGINATYSEEKPALNELLAREVEKANNDVNEEYQRYQNAVDVLNEILAEQNEEKRRRAQLDEIMEDKRQLREGMDVDEIFDHTFFNPFN